MRTIYTISTAVAFFAAAAVAASSNYDFNPVSFAASEKVPSELTSDFTTFRWKGDSAVALETFNLFVDDSTRIQVTDYKNRGDSFEVFDNGKSLGFTSEVEEGADGKTFAATPEEALDDERFSKGIFTLEKGEHKITIKATGPYEAGTAAIRLMDHADVAFHKKGGHKNDEDDEDWRPDEEDDWHHGNDEEEDWNEEEDEDYEEKWEKDYEEKYAAKHSSHEHKGHHHEEIYPPYYDLDLSHTITITKTTWVDQEIPSFPAESSSVPASASAPASSAEPADPTPTGGHRDHGRTHDHDHNRNHGLPHGH